jgi:hypothetical protein
VKAAILQTLAVVIRKGGAALKPFLPQLQTTFVKCLHDSARTVRRRLCFALRVASVYRCACVRASAVTFPAVPSQVRMRAANALGLLMQLQTRLDPLCTELLNGLQASDTDAGVREALSVALRDVVKKAGAHITLPMLERIVSVLQQARVPAAPRRLLSLLSALRLDALPAQDVAGQSEEALSARAHALGAAATFLPAPEFDALVALLMTVRAGRVCDTPAHACGCAQH